MKVLLAGCGSAGTRHLLSLIGLGIPASDITILERPEFVAEGYPFTEVTVCRGYEFWAQSPRPSFGAYVIATPADQHAPWIRQAIGDGVPFFVEKPAVTTVAALTPAEWATDVPHVVGYQLRFHPAVRLLKASLPQSADLRLDCDMASWPGGAYASPLLECSHEIDLACHLLGHGTLLVANSWGPTRWSLLLAHPGGHQSTIEIDAAAGDYLRRWRVVSPVNGQVTVEFHSPDQVAAYGYLEELAHFLDVARGETKSRSTLGHARRVVEICDQAIQRVA